MKVNINEGKRVRSKDDINNNVEDPESKKESNLERYVVGSY